MAIIVESEQGSRMNLAVFLGWIFVLVLLGAAVYFIFFKEPDLISFQVPAAQREEFDTMRRISELNINRSKLEGNPFFSGRDNQVPLTIPVLPGRQNPFLP